MVTHVVELCGEGEKARREHCDRLLFTLDRMNAELGTHIVPHALQVPCAQEDRAFEAFLALDGGGPLAAVFASCL